MNLTNFIRQNRKIIDSAIERRIGDNDFPHNDEERRLWILNDEGLYNFAKSQGVKI